MDVQGKPISSLRTLRTFTLDLPPSCIEFCPAYPEYFVVGTYNLEKQESDAGNIAASEGDEETRQQRKQPQNRNGSLILFALTGTNISHVQTVPYPSAILDVHFHPRQGRNDVMAVVSSTGTLSFFKLVPPSEGCSATLKEIVTHRPLGEDTGILLLSCAWHPNLQDLLAITTSSHEVHILRVDKAWDISKTTEEPVITHTLEAWTVAFSPSLLPCPDSGDQNSNESQSLMVFSGGDDSKLLSTTCIYHPSRLTSEDESIETPYPTTTFRGHEAGVTAILPLTLKLADDSTIVVTGSYDDHLRVYRVYPHEGGFMTQRPSIVAEDNLGGGVWRLKLVKLEESSEAKTGLEGMHGWTALIVASCMHAGCRIVEISGNYEGGCRISVLARFEEHKSMNYGSDFQPGSEQDHKHQTSQEGLRCISTSFYDRLLCLWNFGVTE